MGRKRPEFQITATAVVSILLASVLLGSACSAPPGAPLKEAEIVGTYHFQNPTGIEDLTLRPDGTYEEVFTYNAGRFDWFSGFRPGKVYRNSGQWSYSIVNSEARVMLVQAMLFGGGAPGDPPPDLFNRKLRAYSSGGRVVLESVADPDGADILYKAD